MSYVLDVTPEHFAAASRVFGATVAHELASHGRRLSAALFGCVSMAGTDPAGASWAASYDDAAAAAVLAMQDATNACYRLAALLEQTGFNYAGAESASTLTVAWSRPDRTRWDSYSAAFDTPPSAAGGSSPTPHGWGFVQHLVDAAWPNGHQDRLRAAARAWSSSADALDTAASQTLGADACLMAELTPESGAALTASRAMQDHLRSVAAAHRSLATACEQYAHHLDVAHHQVICELVSLLEWSIGIEIGGVLLSIVTLGLAEGPTQAAEGARVAEAAARITAVLRTCEAAVETGRAALVAVNERAVAVRLRLRILLDSRVVVADVRAARSMPSVRHLIDGEAAAIRALSKAKHFRLPPMVASTADLEKKFKHALDLGVTTKRSAAGFREFGAALDKFISLPATVRLSGRYHGEAAVLSVDPTTRLCVVQRAGGELWTVFELDETQYMHVITKGSLGGN